MNRKYTDLLNDIAQDQLLDAVYGRRIRRRLGSGLAVVAVVAIVSVSIVPRWNAGQPGQTRDDTSIPTWAESPESPFVSDDQLMAVLREKDVLIWATPPDKPYKTDDQLLEFLSH